MQKSAEYKNRLKGLFRAGSLSSFTDLEKLSLLLCYVTASVDVRAVAEELLDRFLSFKDVISATPEALSASGINDRTVTFLLLLKECAGACLLGSLTGRGLEAYSELIDYLYLTFSLERVEKFIAVYLDSEKRFTAVEVLHEGTINHTAVYPRKAIELALAHKASSVIFVHNHPSGDPAPSAADRTLGIELEKAASAIDLHVIDHIVIAADGYFSANGLGKA